MRVLIADDEALARQRLRRLLGALDDVEVVGECKDGQEVLQRLRNDVSIDVVLLDIHMPGLDGMEALSLLDDDAAHVVFCTAHADRAVEAFEHGAVDYLLKPIEAARLQRALQRAGLRRAAAPTLDAKPPAHVAVSTRQGVLLLSPQDISHAVLEGELVVVVTPQQRLLTEFSLQELDDKLGGPPFVRVHRRALLNLDHVALLQPLSSGGYTARMRSGDEVQVSRAAARRLRKDLDV